MSLPSFDVEGEPAEVVGLGDDHALGPTVGDDEVGRDRVGAVVDPRDHARTARSGRRRGTRTSSRSVIGGSMPKNVDSVASSGSTLYRSASSQNRSLSSCTLSGMLGGEVVGLGEVVGQVVQLGGSRVRIPDARRVRRERLRGEHPGDALGLHRQPPAVLVHAPGCRWSRSTAGCGAPARPRRSATAANVVPCIGSCSIPSTVGGCGIPAMSRIVGATSITWRELRAQAAVVRRRRAGQCTTSGLRVPPRCEPTCLPHWNGVLPAHAQAARVVRVHDLARPTGRARRSARTSCSCISSVSGMPFCMVSSLNEPVIGALHAGAVVTPDPQDQRVVELAQLVDRVDDPTDVVVGVLRVAGVDLHLAGVERLEVVGHVVPRRERRRRAASARRRPG